MCIWLYACFMLPFLCSINRHCLQAYRIFLIQWKYNYFICHESTQQHPKDQIWIKPNDPPCHTLLNIPNISYTSCMTSAAGARTHTHKHTHITDFKRWKLVHLSTYRHKTIFTVQKLLLTPCGCIYYRAVHTADIHITLGQCNCTQTSWHYTQGVG
jgi:hypothetical protein